MSVQTILIIEDQKGFRGIYRDVLLDGGFKVLEAEDGVEGWKKVQEHLPDLLLLDLGLPRLSGYEVLKRVRSHSETAHIPVLIFSVMSDPKEVKKCLDAGANDYMVKGLYKPRQVLNTIKSILDQASRKKAPDFFKLRVFPDRADALALQNAIGLTDGYRCPQCQLEMVLELSPQENPQEGHWFSSRFLCPKCGRVF